MKCRFCKSKDVDYIFKKFGDKEKKEYEGRIYLCFNCGRLTFKPKTSQKQRNTRPK